MKAPELEVLVLWLAPGGRRMELRGPMKLRAGCIYLMVGRSGSGKTSIARALLGLTGTVEPVLASGGHAVLRDAGDAAATLTLLDGTDYDDDAREHCAYLPQAGSLGLIADLGAEGNLTLFSSLGRVDAKLHAENTAARLRLWPLPKSLPRASGGEQVRISAARALMPRSRAAKHPALIIADEPTAGLDPKAADAMVAALKEIARGGHSVVVVITHEPAAFVANPPGDLGEGVRVIECTFVDERMVAGKEAAQFVRLEPPHEPSRALKLVRAALSATCRFVDGIGALAMSPVSLVMGAVTLKRRLWRQAAGEVLRTALNPGTVAFTAAAAVLIAVTTSVFIFNQLPRRELLEPLLMPDMLAGAGIALLIVLLPVVTAVFAVAKNGAAQAARFSASVKGGLLDTLLLARVTHESYALLPAVLGQVASLALCTLVAIGLGVTAAAAVFVASGAQLALPDAVSVIWSGVAGFDDWGWWLAAKVGLSGVAGGVIAAQMGMRPAGTEREVSEAVHRALLWGMFAVLIVQCWLVIAEFNLHKW